MREYLKIIGKWSTNKALVPASLGDFSQLLPILVEVCVRCVFSNGWSVPAVRLFYHHLSVDAECCSVWGVDASPVGLVQRFAAAKPRQKAPRGDVGEGSRAFRPTFTNRDLSPAPTSVQEFSPTDQL